MSIEGSSSDYPLRDVIAILSRRGESGRLQIDFRSVQGALYFREGKLVDARMGSLTGFLAVNLAISLEEAHFHFDPLFQVPAASFIDSNESLLLKELLGIAAIAAGEATGRASGDEGTELAIAPPSLPVPLKRTFTGAKTTDSQTGTDPQFHGVLARQPLAHNAHRKIAFRAAAILLIGIPAAVGIAAYWRRGNVAVPQKVSPSHLAEAYSPPGTDTPSSTRRSDNIPAMNANTWNSKTGPSDFVAKATHKNGATESSATGTAHPQKNRETSSSPIETKAVDKDRTAANLVFRDIPVIVQINDGRVAEAYIKNHHAGWDAYEATALRLARQRRFPKDTTGFETIVFQVTDKR